MINQAFMFITRAINSRCMWAQALRRASALLGLIPPRGAARHFSEPAPRAAAGLCITNGARRLLNVCRFTDDAGRFRTPGSMKPRLFPPALPALATEALMLVLWRRRFLSSTQSTPARDSHSRP